MAEDCADDDDDKSAIRKLRTSVVKKLQSYPTLVQKVFPKTEYELEVVEKLYYQAMQLEVDFFSAQPDIKQAVLPLSRAHDEIAIRKALKINNQKDLWSTWSTLSSQYVEGYERCIESIMLGEPAKGFNYEWLCKAFDQLSGFEKGANAEVVESAVLKGLNIEDIKWAGKHLILQDGCRDFFRAIVNNNEVGTDVHVLSYCWSGDLIRSAFTSGDMPISSIHSNELLYDGFMTTGDISKTVESPMEKLQAFLDICRGYRDEDKKLSVYIGGSVGDLPCLLQADVGIVISPGTSLKKLGYQFGVSFVPLFSGAVKKQREFIDGGSCWKGMSGVLYTVSSWAEIHAFILGS